MATEHRGNDTSDPLPATLPAALGSRGCRPLAALDLGYHTRQLWAQMGSVWAGDGDGILPVDPALDGVHHALLVLADRLTTAQLDHFTHLRTAIEDHQNEACMFVGSLRSELLVTWKPAVALVDGHHNFDGYADLIERLLPELITERWQPWVYQQERHWSQVRAICDQAVEGDRSLDAWREVGFKIADLTMPIASHQASSARTRGGVRTLHQCIDNLPGPDRMWVRTLLGVGPLDAPGSAALLHEKYLECRSLLPGWELQADTPTPRTTAGAEFVQSDEYTVVRWRCKDYQFNKSQAVMVKALHDDFVAGKPGLSATKLFRLADLDRGDVRVEHVFRHYDATAHKWIKHPALVDGLLVKAGKVWRLDPETRH